MPSTEFPADPLISSDVRAALERPFASEPVLQLRTGTVKPLYNIPITSALLKTRRRGPIRVVSLGLTDDEQAWPQHGGLERAVMMYCSQHYAAWKQQCPESASRFDIGGFGENIVTSVANERNTCIGDVVRIGGAGGVELQVTQSRPPCFKLNHRFQVKDISRRCQMQSRTGWFLRVLREGTIEEGDEMVLVKRIHPDWTVARVQHFLYKDMKNRAAMEEIVALEELGAETRNILLNRLKNVFENQDQRIFGGDEMALRNTWRDYRLVSKSAETSRICSLVFEAVTATDPVTAVPPGSHVRIKVGNSKDLTRSYSVIGGTNYRFELGVSKSDISRGGSHYLHSVTQVGDILSLTDAATTFPLATGAGIDQHILIAGGIGITAFLSTASQLCHTGTPFQLHLAVRSTADVPFRHYLDRLSSDEVHIYDHQNRLNVPEIVGRANDNTHIYCCGPAGLMEEVARTAKNLGLRDSQVHFEAFDTVASGDPFEVQLERSQKFIRVESHKSLLDTLREAGIEVESSCEAGNCGTCALKVLDGRVDHHGTGLLEEDKGMRMLSCVSRGIGRIIVDL